MNKYFIFLALTILSLDLLGQQSLSLDISRATFNGNNNTFFKPTTGINLEYEKNKFFFGIGYSNFKPISDTIYFTDEYSTTGYGILCFEDYLIIPIYVGRNFPINIGEKIVLKPGVQIGYAFVRYEYNYKYSLGGLDDVFVGSTIGFTPRISFCYKLNEKWESYFNTKYNFIALSNIGIHSYYSIGFGVRYYLK